MFCLIAVHTAKPLPSSSETSRSTMSTSCICSSTYKSASFCPVTLFTTKPSLFKNSVKFFIISLSSSTKRMLYNRLLIIFSLHHQIRNPHAFFHKNISKHNLYYIRTLHYYINRKYRKCCKFTQHKRKRYGHYPCKNTVKQKCDYRFSA